MQILSVSNKSLNICTYLIIRALWSSFSKNLQSRISLKSFRRTMFYDAFFKYMCHLAICWKVWQFFSHVTLQFIWQFKFVWRRFLNYNYKTNITGNFFKFGHPLHQQASHCLSTHSASKILSWFYYFGFIEIQ